MKAAAVLVALGLAANGTARAQEDKSDTTDWPCQQRYVETLSPGVIWTGPPIDEYLDGWWEDQQVFDVVGSIMQRDLEPEFTKKKIEKFAQGLGENKNEKLTKLFAGLFQKTNELRGRDLEGIKAYVRRQEELTASISDTSAKLRELDEEGVPKDDPRRLDLESKLDWSSRVFDERARLVEYICEVPVLLEQKLGQAARVIASHLDEEGKS